MEFFKDSLISGFSAHGFQLPSLFFINETRKMSTGTRIDVTKLMNKPSTATVEVPCALWWGRSDLYQIAPPTTTTTTTTTPAPPAIIAETVNIGQVKCGKVKYQCKMTVTYMDDCSMVSKVTPNCSPKKSKCTKGVAVSIETANGCTVTGKYKNTGKKQSMSG